LNTWPLGPASRYLPGLHSRGYDAAMQEQRATQELQELPVDLIENVARKDLNPVEEARACEILVEE
jgi:hypothetical protein